MQRIANGGLHDNILEFVDVCMHNVQKGQTIRASGSEWALHHKQISFLSLQTQRNIKSTGQNCPHCSLLLFLDPSQQFCVVQRDVLTERRHWQN